MIVVSTNVKKYYKKRTKRKELKVDLVDRKGEFPHKETMDVANLIIS